MALNLPPISSATGFAAPTEDSDGNKKIEQPYLYKTKEEAVAVLKSGKRILGEPGASLTWGIDGNRDLPQLESGMEGEKQTAGILAEVMEKTPGMFVFHSLSWPESNGDTDHIVVYKDLILVIDSKRWKSARKYSITAKGEIMRGTVPFDEGKVKIGYALKQWREKIPGKPTVRGVVTIAQEKVFVTRDSNWYKAPYRLVEAEKLEEYLVKTMNDHKAKVSKTPGSTLVYLATLLVQGRDRRRELIPVRLSI